MNKVYLTGYVGGKRYVRVALAAFGATSSGTFMDVLAFGGRARNLPVNS